MKNALAHFILFSLCLVFMSMQNIFLSGLAIDNFCIGSHHIILNCRLVTMSVNPTCGFNENVI